MYTVLTREPLGVFAKESRALEKICRSLLAGDEQGRLRAGSCKRCPAALSASLAFRIYLAKRDLFVRRSASAVFQLRQLLQREQLDDAQRLFRQLRAEVDKYGAALRAGRQAARVMWMRSRSARWPSQNDRMLRADARRVRG